jgi:hypothetical protein
MAKVKVTLSGQRYNNKIKDSIAGITSMYGFLYHLAKIFSIFCLVVSSQMKARSPDDKGQLKILKFV